MTPPLTSPSSTPTNPPRSPAPTHGASRRSSTPPTYASAVHVRVNLECSRRRSGKAKSSQIRTLCFIRIVAAVGQSIFPDAVVVGGIMVGGTDSKHFTALSDFVYRFCPTWMLKSDIPRFHVRPRRFCSSLSPATCWNGLHLSCARMFVCGRFVCTYACVHVCMRARCDVLAPLFCCSGSGRAHQCGQPCPHLRLLRQCCH